MDDPDQWSRSRYGSHKGNQHHASTSRDRSRIERIKATNTPDSFTTRKDGGTGRPVSTSLHRQEERPDQSSSNHQHHGTRQDVHESTEKKKRKTENVSDFWSQVDEERMKEFLKVPSSHRKSVRRSSSSSDIDARYRKRHTTQAGTSRHGDLYPRSPRQSRQELEKRHHSSKVNEPAQLRMIYEPYHSDKRSRKADFSYKRNPPPGRSYAILQKRSNPFIERYRQPTDYPTPQPRNQASSSRIRPDFQPAYDTERGAEYFKNVYKWRKHVSSSRGPPLFDIDSDIMDEEERDVNLINSNNTTNDPLTLPETSQNQRKGKRRADGNGLKILGTWFQLV